MNFIKNPTVIIIILGVVFGGSLYFYNRYQESKKVTTTTSENTATTVIADLTNSDPKDFESENKAELALAQTKATAYKADATLSGLEITFPGNLKPRSGNATYIFDSTKDTTNHFSISIAQESQNFIRAIIPKEDYFGNITTINQKSWRLSYIDALKVAEKNGGQDWRQNNTLSKLKLTLKNGQPKGWLYWYADYQSETSSFSAQIDAYSGRFVFPDELSASSSSTNSSTSQTTP